MTRHEKSGLSPGRGRTSGIDPRQDPATDNPEPTHLENGTMVDSDEKRDLAGERPEPPPKKKKLVTPEMRAASRKNSYMSTGPKSTLGKSKASLNACSHLQTCTKFLFLPDESPEEFEAQVARYARQLGAKTEPEVDQIRVGVYNVWKMLRIEKAGVCAVRRTVHGIVDTFHDTKQSGVRKLSADLMAQPGNTVDGLMQSTAGCSYLI